MAAPASYSFTPLYQHSDQFSSLGNPWLNNNGEIAFRATRADGTIGIFSAGTNGGPVTTIYLNSESFLNLEFSPTIADSGLITFRARSATGTESIFAGNGGPLTTLVETNGQFGNLSDPTVMSAGGSVAFVGGDGPGGDRDGVFATSGGSITTIATYDTRSTLFNHPNDRFSNFGGEVSMNSVGGVAFYASYELYKEDFPGFPQLIELGEGIFTSSGGDPTPVLLYDGSVQFSAATDINDSGLVGLRGTGGVFTARNGNVRTIADGGGAYNEFVAHSINNDGTVAFEATLDSGGFFGLPADGIFTGADPVADGVIKTGDGLFGSTVWSVSMVDGGALNDRGEIAFNYTLLNGQQGIALAHFHPSTDRTTVVLNQDNDGTDAPPFPKDKLRVLEVDNASPVGVVQEVEGPVTVTRNGEQFLAEAGTPIYMNDVIETPEVGRANIVFVDDTNFAVSPNARLDIDEYVYDPGAESPESNFNFLRGVFERLAPGDPQDPGNNDDVIIYGVGIRGDATPYINWDPLDPAAEMRSTVGPVVASAGDETTSSVTLYTSVEVTEAPFELTFDYAFFDSSGTLEVEIDGISLVTLTGASSEANAVYRHTLDVTDPAILELLLAELAFTYDGPVGSSLFIDNVSMSGLNNGDFGLWDNGWFARGPGQVDLIATVVPEPSALSLLGLLAFAGRRARPRVRRVHRTGHAAR